MTPVRPRTKATINFPTGIALDTRGNLFIADAGDNRIRRVNAVTGLINTVAGNGAYGFSGDGRPATKASMAGPGGVGLTPDGDLFIADSSNNRVREVPLPPFVTLSTTNVTFPTQVVGTRSKPQLITLLDTGTAPLSIFSLVIGGANAGDFGQSNYCGSSVAPGERCYILVTFDPTGAGRRTATLTITDNAPDSPRTVTLSGTSLVCREPCLVFHPQQPG